MKSEINQLLVEMAPYISAFLAVLVSYLSYRESERKTWHDELSDLYDKVAADNARLRRENEELRRQLREEESHDKD